MAVYEKTLPLEPCEPLTRLDLEERVDEASLEVYRSLTAGRGPILGDAPCKISARELIECVRPFLSMN